MSSAEFHESFEELRHGGVPFVSVTLIEAIGSTPQDAGAKMLVTKEGLHSGTVGGGRIEAHAIQEAQSLLSDSDSSQTKFFEWNLQRDIGMTCGGVVKMFFERYQVGAWNIMIFGAGHVTQALTRILITLPCQVTCVDPRQDWLDKLPKSPNLKAIQTEDPSDCVSQLSERDFVLSMTKGHASDFPVLLEIFRQKREFPFLGVIGSHSKSVVLRKELEDAGISKDKAVFACPVGLPIGTNNPAEIAISIAAQLLQVRDEIATNRKR